MGPSTFLTFCKLKSLELCRSVKDLLDYVRGTDTVLKFECGELLVGVDSGISVGRGI